GRVAELNGVEAERAEPLEGLAAMLYGAGHQRPAADHEERAVDCGRCFGWLIAAGSQIGGGGPAGDLRAGGAIEVDVAVDLQVVDPKIDGAGGAVAVEHDQVDEGFTGVDLGAELRSQVSRFLIEQAADVADGELLPLAHVGVHVAAKERGDGLVGAAVEIAGKDDAGHELHAGAVGFDVERRLEFLDQRGAADGMNQRQERAVAEGQVWRKDNAEPTGRWLEGNVIRS